MVDQEKTVKANNVNGQKGKKKNTSFKSPFHFLINY